MALRTVPKVRAKAPGRPAGEFTQARRLDRLRQALEAHPPGLELATLADMLRVSTRSVRRYLIELGHIVELESMPVEAGGAHLWRIKPEERGRTIALRRAQAFGLLALREVLEGLRGSALFDDLDVALREIRKVAKRPARAAKRGELSADDGFEDRFAVLPAVRRTYPGQADGIDMLFQAVAERRVIRYAGAAGAAPISFLPHGLYLYRGELLVLGRDAGEEPFRVVPFSSMRGVELREKERFKLDPGFEPGLYLHGELGVHPPVAAPIAVLIEFDRATGESVRTRRVHPSQKWAAARDGRVRLSMQVPTLEMVADWLLPFGPRARAIFPPELISMVRASAQATLDRYPTE